MQVAANLNKDIEEVLSWDPDKFALWVEYLRLENERARKARGKP